MESFFKLSFLEKQSEIECSEYSKTEKASFEVFQVFSPVFVLNIFYRQNLVRNSLRSPSALSERSGTECERVSAS